MLHILVFKGLGRRRNVPKVRQRRVALERLSHGACTFFANLVVFEASHVFAGWEKSEMSTRTTDNQHAGKK